MSNLSIVTPRLSAWGGSDKLMILCRDMYALLHVSSLIDWPKHFFFFLLQTLQKWCSQACFDVLY